MLNHDPLQRSRAATITPAVGLFGCALRAARETHGLSQSRLALLAGCDHSYVSRLENGMRPTATRPLVLRFAAALALSDAEQAALLLAAGYVPECRRTAHALDPDLAAADELLRNHAGTIAADALRLKIRHATDFARSYLAAYESEGAAHDHPA